MKIRITVATASLMLAAPVFCQVSAPAGAGKTPPLEVKRVRPPTSGKAFPREGVPSVDQYPFGRLIGELEGRGSPPPGRSEGSGGAAPAFATANGAKPLNNYLFNALATDGANQNGLRIDHPCVLVFQRPTAGGRVGRGKKLTTSPASPFRSGGGWCMLPMFQVLAPSETSSSPGRACSRPRSP